MTTTAPIYRPAAPSPLPVAFKPSPRAKAAAAAAAAAGAVSPPTVAYSKYQPRVSPTVQGAAHYNKYVPRSSGESSRESSPDRHRERASSSPRFVHHKAPSSASRGRARSTPDYPVSKPSLANATEEDHVSFKPVKGKKPELAQVSVYQSYRPKRASFDGSTKSSGRTSSLDRRSV